MSDETLFCACGCGKSAPVSHAPGWIAIFQKQPSDKRGEVVVPKAIDFASAGCLARVLSNIMSTRGAVLERAGNDSDPKDVLMFGSTGIGIKT